MTAPREVKVSPSCTHTHTRTHTVSPSSFYFTFLHPFLLPLKYSTLDQWQTHKQFLQISPFLSSKGTLPLAVNTCATIHLSSSPPTHLEPGRSRKPSIRPECTRLIFSYLCLRCSVTVNNISRENETQSGQRKKRRGKTEKDTHHYVNLCGTALEESLGFKMHFDHRQNTTFSRSSGGRDLNASQCCSLYNDLSVGQK